MINVRDFIENCKQEIIDFRDNGSMPSDLVYNILCNDLIKVVFSEEITNIVSIIELKGITQYVYDIISLNISGSKTKVDNWIDSHKDDSFVNITEEPPLDWEGLPY